MIKERIFHTSYLHLELHMQVTIDISHVVLELNMNISALEIFCTLQS